MSTVSLFLCTFACFCSAAFSQVLINEVLYDPSGTDTGKEKIEIRNVGSTTIDLTGYDLSPDGIGYFTFPSASLAPGAIAVVHLRQTGPNTASDFFHSTPSSNMGNASGSVALFNATTHNTGTLVSFVQWGSGGNPWATTAVSAGLWPSVSDSVPGVLDGHSIEYDGSGFSPADWLDQAVPTMGSSNSLPVQLVGFSASRTENSVFLAWETLSEVDNFGFEIERRLVPSYELRVPSSDLDTRNPELETPWIRIGFVPGAGSSQVRRRYSFVDNAPFRERSSYRLRQLDRGGLFSFSDVVEVGEVSPAESMMLECYPNPFNPVTAVSYQVPAFPPFAGMTAGAISDVRLSVFDMLGREVAVLVNEGKVPGDYSVTWNASSMQSGVYFAAYEIRGKRISKKMLLVK